MKSLSLFSGELQIYFQTLSLGLLHGLKEIFKPGILIRHKASKTRKNSIIFRVINIYWQK